VTALLIAFKWPIAVVAVVTLILFALRGSITRLVDRIHEVDWGHRRVRAGTVQQQQPEELPTPGTTPPELPGDPAVDAAIAYVRTELQLDRIPDAAERERRLVQVTAQASLSWLCERTYRTIFGSQIRGLESLNVAGPQSREVVRVDYDIAAGGNPGLYDQYPFESWFGYLTGSHLVVEQDGLVHITHFGRLLLIYMVQQGLDTMKAN
jgi:hypothetical protein